MGIVVTLPVRADGPDVLRQVNKFSQEIWKLANDPAKGVAFVVFADNQHFYDEFKGLNENEKKELQTHVTMQTNALERLFMS